MLDLRSLTKSERAGDSAAKRARRSARVCGNSELVVVVVEGVWTVDEKGLVIVVVAEIEAGFRARTKVVNRDCMVFSSLSLSLSNS